MVTWGVGLWLALNALFVCCRLYHTRGVDPSGAETSRRGLPSTGNVTTVVRLVPKIKHIKHIKQNAQGNPERASDALVHLRSKAAATKTAAQK